MSTPANQQYGTSTAHGGGGGTLPFTGADVAIPMTAGILALLVGLAFRRLTKHANLS